MRRAKSNLLHCPTPGFGWISRSIMVDYGKAFKTPFVNVGSLFAGTFVLLGLMLLIFFIVFLVMFIVLGATFVNPVDYLPIPILISIYLATFLIEAAPYGFVFKYACNVSKKRFEIPSWSTFGSHFLNGIPLVIINVIYYIPIMIIYFFVLGSNPLNTAFSPEAQQAVAMEMLARLPLIMLVMLPLYLLMAYLIPIVLLRYAETKRFNEAFNFKVIFRKAFNSTYLTAWLLTAAISIGMFLVFYLALIIFALLSLILIGIPLLITAIGMFFYLFPMITMGILGQAYGEVK